MCLFVCEYKCGGNVVYGKVYMSSCALYILVTPLCFDHITRPISFSVLRSHRNMFSEEEKIKIGIKFALIYLLVYNRFFVINKYINIQGGKSF